MMMLNINLNKSRFFARGLLLVMVGMAVLTVAKAQVNAVEFGKNRVQYKKFKWQYYRTQNYNIYFNEGGKELAQFVAQIAERELPQIEKQTEFSLQRRIDIILYNQYSDMEQSNIGLGQEWQTNSGIAKLVNNKMVLHYEGDHDKLRLQVRAGIAKIIVYAKLYGSTFGERTQNANFLDLPAWFVDGYVSYVAERWSTAKDDALKNEILSGKYRRFGSLAFAKPELAGHGFWYYIDELYKKENTAYFLYLTMQSKSADKACKIITKKKFKEVLRDFMEYQVEKYDEDITNRRPYPKGTEIESFDVSKRRDYFRFNINPNKRNNSYVVAQWKKGIVRVIYNDEETNKTLLKYGARTDLNEINPNYPIMAWDNKGTRIAVAYINEGRTNLFVYDIMNKVKPIKLDLSKTFDQVLDMKYSPDSKKMLFTAVKNGHNDLYIMDMTNEKVTQVTNDVYDDMDATFVNFPNKNGIIFSSNRPGPNSRGDSTTLPSNNRFNVFMVTNFNNLADFNQITQLTNLKYGNARNPMQYNVNHFTFTSDENGIGNRWAGFFVTKAAGVDTLVLIGNEMLRNPTVKEVDSTLRVLKRTDIDSTALVRVTEDSTYTFPITNYESSLSETRIAGDNGQVSEVTQQGDQKTLYKLKINEVALRRRNVNAKPTAYAKRLVDERNAIDILKAPDDVYQKDVPKDTTVKIDDVFQTEFVDTIKTVKNEYGEEVKVEELVAQDVLGNAKLFPYKPRKFAVDAADAQVNTTVLFNRFEPFNGGVGPIMLNRGTPLSGLIRLGTTELMEDVLINGGYRLGTNFKDNEWLLNFQNRTKRLDYGLTFYRNVQSGSDAGTGIPLKLISNIYQGNINYAFTKNKSLRLISGIRSEKYVVQAEGFGALTEPDFKSVYSTNRVEFINDNSKNKQNNIWHGYRYKIAFDWNTQINKLVSVDGPNTFIASLDARYYHSIYRNFIWAGRAAADFSFGNQKMIYYLGGMDGWLMLLPNLKSDGTERYFNVNNPPAADQNYAFQTLAGNMRGFLQNTANGNNAIVFNSEFRLPVVSTLIDRPVTSKFFNDLQITQFIDLGTAWNGQYNKLSRPETVIVDPGNAGVVYRQKVGGVGPFAGGYGFGARSTLFGYFVKFDAAWQMNGFFRGKPKCYISLGLDF